MDKSENIHELAKALSAAQGEFEPAKMGAINPFLKNKYADLGSVIAASKAACAKYGLAVTQPASTDGENVIVTTMLLHQSGQWISSSMTLPLGKESGRSVAQSAGSIITYLRRYSLSAILGIYADTDTDGNDEPKSKVAKQTTAVAQPPPPEPAAVETQTASGAPMTLAEAQDMTNREGLRYGDIDNAKLVFMANSLAALPARTPEQESKMLAIQLIFAARYKEATDQAGG